MISRNPFRAALALYARGRSSFAYRDAAQLKRYGAVRAGHSVHDFGGPPLSRDLKEEARVADMMTRCVPERHQEVLTESVENVHRTLSVLDTSKPLSVLIAIRLLYGDARSLCSVHVLRRKGGNVIMSSEAVQATGFFVGAAEAITQGDQQFFSVDQAVGKIAAIVGFSIELDEDADSSISFIELFVDSLTSSLLKAEDVAVFRGDGSPTFGNQTGVLHASTNIVPMDAGDVSFENISREYLKRLRDAVPVGRRRNAKWLLSPESVSRLQDEKDLHGAPLVRELDGSGYMLGTEIAGYPEGLPALSQSDGPSKKFAACGDPLLIALGISADALLFSRSATLQDVGDGSIILNAFYADSVIGRLTESIVTRLMVPDGISVLQTAAA